MRFEFVPCNAIPRLAWCAHLRRAGDLVRVYHGPWVETRDGWFVEGAWTGDFEKGDIDCALFNVGTGGVIRDGRAVFVSPTDVRSRIFSARHNDDIFISNSLVFALAMAQDELDPFHPYYSADVIKMYEVGIGVPVTTLMTRGGRGVNCHSSCQIAVGSDLTVQRIEKPAFAPPRNYADFVGVLRGVMKGVLLNADSPARRHARYKGIATVSGGYDANALAALAVELGVRETICFYDHTPGDDGGPAIAKHLGLDATEYARMGFRDVPDLCEAEFLAWPGGQDVVMAPCAKQVVGRVLILGRNGDAVLTTDPAKALGEYRNPVAYMGGVSIPEFRFRVGFLDFNAFYTAALHSPRICEISRSEEMRPWSLGGKYDRPIARRLVEEAGVPRSMFGITKAATANFPMQSIADLGPASREALRNYRRGLSAAGRMRCASYRALVKVRSALEKVADSLGNPGSTAGRVAASLIPIPSRFQGFDEIAFSTAWSHTIVRQRYITAIELHRTATRQADGGKRAA